jgi:glycosyltransferase involved in cell wall biosynthesis
MKKKILVISPIPSHPQSAGNRIRIYNLLNKFKQKGYNIHFLFCDLFFEDFTSGKKPDLSKMKREWDKFFYFNPHKFFLCKYNFLLGNVGKFLKMKIPFLFFLLKPFFPDKNLNKILSDRYNGLDSFFPEDLEKKLSSILKKEKYDIVLAEYVIMSKAFECVSKDTLKIIDTHDTFSDGTNQSMHLSVMEESKGLSRADIVLAIQKKEKKYFEEIIKKYGKNRLSHVIEIGHLTNLQKFKKKKLDKNLLFVGAGIHQNIEGINFFIKEVLPLLKKEIPNIKLKIVGNVCKEIDSSECEKFGVVDDLKNVYEKSDLVIAPIFLGSGLKIKLIESLSYNLPVVCTSHVASPLEKLSKIKNSPLLIADTPQEFVNQIKRIFEDGNYNQRRKNASLFIKNYNKEINKKIEKLLNYKNEKI